MQVFMQPLEKFNRVPGDPVKTSQKPGRPSAVRLRGITESPYDVWAFHGMEKDAGREDLNCLIIAENDLKAKELYEDYRMYDPNVLLYPAKDLIFFQADVHGNLLTRERMKAVAALLEKKRGYGDYQFRRMYGLPSSSGSHQKPYSDFKK